MEIYTIDKNTLSRTGVIDQYISFLWNIEYNDVGSFELNLDVSYFDRVQSDTIIQCTDDLKHNGIVEYIAKNTQDNGSETLTVKGRLLESILDRRIVVGGNSFSSVQPAQIASSLITSNAISNRPIPGLEIGELVNAPEGVIDYAAENISLLDAVKNVCATGNIGFRMYVDSEDNKIIFETFIGENRTEKDNTTTSIEENTISNVLNNAKFSNGFSGWTEFYNRRAYDYDKEEYISGYPLTASNGIAAKTRVKSRGVMEDEKGNKKKYDIWEKSPYVTQETTLTADHIYFISASCMNKTSSVIGFGFDNMLSFTYTGERYDRLTALYVPESNGSVTFFAGYGELEEKENQYVYFKDLILIDLTKEFGIGDEPTLDWCTDNIYYNASGELTYKTQTITFIKNANMPLVFSRDRDLLITSQYEKNTTNEKNFLYIKGANDTSATITSDGGTAKTGFDLKESFVDLSSISKESSGVEIPDASYLSMIKSNGKGTLKQTVVSEIVGGDLYLLSNVVFGVDYDVGDIASFREDNINFSVDYRISSAKISYGREGKKISVELGNDIPKFYDLVKLVSKGAR